MFALFDALDPPEAATRASAAPEPVQAEAEPTPAELTPVETAQTEPPAPETVLAETPTIEPPDAEPLMETEMVAMPETGSRSPEPLPTVEAVADEPPAPVEIPRPAAAPHATADDVAPARADAGTGQGTIMA